ncbi:hypothetical protein JCM8208_001390 [Rhodotorula glutinis]
MNSLPPSSAPARRRKKQPKSCRLVRLPVSILRLIFGHFDQLPLNSVTLCRPLYPVLIDQLYHLVALTSPRKIRSFATVLVQHPERGRLVNTLTLHEQALKASKDAPVDFEREMGAGQLHDRESAPSCKDLVIGIGLIKDIVYLLPRVNQLVIWGDQLATYLFSPVVAAHPAFPRPRNVYLILDSETDSTRAPALWRHVGAAPDLQLLVVHNLDPPATGSILNLDPAAYVAPRSIHIKDFALKQAAALGPGLGHLLRGLASGIERVNFETLVTYRSILDDLVLIPPTLKLLEVSLGLSECTTPTAAADATYRFLKTFMRDEPDAALVPLTKSLVALPNLVTVSLQGDIVTPATFEYLVELEHLETLRLETHTRFETSDVVKFVQGAPALKTLWVEVCCCVPLGPVRAPSRPARPAARAPSSSTPTSPSTKPTWRAGFDLDDARTLISECVVCGVQIGGSIACASRLFKACVPECQGWCTAAATATAV